MEIKSKSNYVSVCKIRVDVDATDSAGRIFSLVFFWCVFLLLFDRFMYSLHFTTFYDFSICKNWDSFDSIFLMHEIAFEIQYLILHATEIQVAVPIYIFNIQHSPIKIWGKRCNCSAALLFNGKSFWQLIIGSERFINYICPVNDFHFFVESPLNIFCYRFSILKCNKRASQKIM